MDMYVQWLDDYVGWRMCLEALLTSSYGSVVCADKRMYMYE
jgi:hypothetical protein